jgi:hypothetical protein
MNALSSIFLRSDGAQAVVKRPVLDRVLDLLASPLWAVRNWSCLLVGKLDRDESVVRVLLESKACEKLVILLK